MSAVVVEQPEGGKIAVNGPKATVTVEADNSREVGDAAAKNLALMTARGFLSKPGISGQSGPYPVDENGEQLVDLSKAGPEGYRFRQDFTIQEGM